jgi:peptidoglycan DL-endopeptidase CwlO
MMRGFSGFIEILRYFVVKIIRMKKYLIIVLIAFVSCELQAQVPQFDKLEMYYAQGHYKVVYRRANRLLDQPDYDYSLLPKFYKSLSLFQLSQNRHWLIRHPNALGEAEKLFTEVRKSADGIKVLSAHIHEVSALKHDLFSWAEDLKRQGDKVTFDRLQKIMAALFDDVPDMQYQGQVKPVDVIVSTGTASAEREALVAQAKKYLGVPYAWAGNDPSGFDCSGYTSFIYKNAGKELPRRAVDQFDGAKKIKEKSVQKGDLVFFDNGSGISHVGIIISDPGQAKVMIHASSSKGIIITDIEKSEYWMKRIAGYGAFLD